VLIKIKNSKWKLKKAKNKLTNEKNNSVNVHIIKGIRRKENNIKKSKIEQNHKDPQ
jgi:precorrin-3B methylase